MFFTILSLVGASTVLYVLWALFKFGRHFLAPSALPRYLHGDAWALVTGASDGIGAALVDELAQRGFNVVLHGRNASKLDKYVAQLQAKHPRRQFRTVILDAKAATAPEIEDLANKMPKNLTVLINNVAAAGDEKKFARFLDKSVASIGRIMAVNEGFPTMLTRALLPQLIANQPALVINVGSVADKWPVVCLEEYGAGKAHNRAFSLALRKCMEVENYDVEVMHLRVTSVSTPGSEEPVSFGTVTPQVFAKGALDRVGCREGTSFGCLRHAVMVGLAETLIPDANQVMGNMGTRMMKAKLGS